MTATPLRGASASASGDDDPRPAFDWEAEQRLLDGLPGGGGHNIAHEAVDRHLPEGSGDRVAIRWIPRRGDAIDISYQELARRTDRFARLLADLGCDRGGRVATLLGRVPELYVAALGTLKAGSVYTPLFSAFGPGPIAQRIDLGSIDVLVTTRRLFTRKVAPILDELTTIRHVLVVGGGDVPSSDPRVRLLRPLLDATSDHWVIPDTPPETPALLHFTSGTTGTPKGVVHVHDAVLTHLVTGRDVLDLQPDDIFWCTADPGWVTGTSYGIISPLVNGVTNIVDEGDFDAARWYSVIEANRVDVWYTAPTALRMLMRVGEDEVANHDLSSLRVVASVGEPLNPEAVRWGEKVFGSPVLDNWWQTETGGIMIANRPGQPVRPGSMGRPIPGIEATVLERNADGDIVVDDAGHAVEVGPDTVGELALLAGWPSMFRGYLNQDDRYRQSFVDGWYRTGDLAKRDADGYFWFVGRGDDVIKSAGHLIGPFEVESALIEHPAVSEAGVIGVPHETMGNLVKAFVTLQVGTSADDALSQDLMAHARRILGPAVAPREIEIVDSLPHTRSGKIMRRLLKARELGQDEGDLSTLDRPDDDNASDGRGVAR